MARGQCIVVSAYREGRKIEGIVATAEKPGTVMQIDPTVALKQGRHTWKKYDRAATGNRPAGPLIILTEDWGQGKTMTDAYTAGDRAFGYIPSAGDELNMLVLDIEGTGDDKVAGALLSIDDGTGKLVAASGDSSPFMLLEDITDPVADTHAWVIYSGY